jgi:hypothetical protein
MIVRPGLRLASAALALVAGCAALRPPAFEPGTAMSAVEARLGKPRGVAKSPAGDTVWQYPNGPHGQTTYMVDFGPDGRVKRVYQALTPERLARVRVGMPEEEIRLLLGPPGQTMRFPRTNEVVWSYHYQAAASDNRIFNVNFDAQTRTVRSTGDQVDELFNPIAQDGNPS